MSEIQKAGIRIAYLMAGTLCFVIVAMTVALLIGMFTDNQLVDNKDVFPIIAPAFSTIVGGFIGWLAALKLTKDEPKGDAE
jgi:hypothetical protein